MDTKTRKGILFALLAAALYAVNSPFSKILLAYMPSTLMAGFLYIGAGVGMIAIALIRRIRKTAKTETRLTKSELPYTIAMILLDIAAPICLLIGLKSTTQQASLLNNFEIVATAIIALMVFKEKISSRLWLGIVFVTLSCTVLSFEDITSLQFSYGSLFILLAGLCWGFENNCTRKISSKDPMQIVLLKGIFSGLGSVIIGLVIGKRITALWSVFAVLGVGCRLWFEYLLLCVCAADTRSGKNKCLLCRCTVHRNITLADYFQRSTTIHILYRSCVDGNRRLGFCKR